MFLMNIFKLKSDFTSYFILDIIPNHKLNMLLRDAKGHLPLAAYKPPSGRHLVFNCLPVFFYHYVFFYSFVFLVN